MATRSKCPVMLLLSLLYCALLKLCQAQSSLNLTFYPSELPDLKEGMVAKVYFNLTCEQVDMYRNQTLMFMTEDQVIAEISGLKSTPIYRNDSEACTDVTSYSFSVMGKRLGKTTVTVYKHQSGRSNEDAGAVIVHEGYKVIVLRVRRTVDDIFRYGIIIMAAVIYLGFGCMIEAKVVWEIIKKPIAPAIGFFGQFVVMPLLGFGLAQLFQLDNNLGFGLLALACSPGGGGSNMFAHLLGGDMDLSMTMTFISTIASLGMTPFWMWALGRFYLGSVTIPYGTIIRTIATIAAPCLVGFILRKFVPKVAIFIRKCTRPLSLIFVLFILSFGTYVNLYMYRIMGTVPQVIPCAIMIPYVGFLLGYLLARLFRIEKPQAGTIGIETGYQNGSIPIIMLQGNFPQPEGDLGAVMPVATSLFTPLPLLVIYTVQLVKYCIDKKKKKLDAEQPNDDDADDDSGSGIGGDKDKVAPLECIEAPLQKALLDGEAMPVHDYRPSSPVNGEANGGMIHSNQTLESRLDQSTNGISGLKPTDSAMQDAIDIKM